MAGAVTINTNLAALNAERRLGQNTQSLQQNFTRLSSGLRINKASDDAAGLAIAASLNVDTRVYAQGIRNLNDGLGALNIADTAIESLTNIVMRLEELAEQAANGTLGKNQRAALDEEAQSLSREYFRIAHTTAFNGQQLLDGSVQELRVQGGYGESGGILAGFGGAMGTGSFGAALSYPIDRGQFFALSLGDVNRDGALDLVTAGHDGYPNGYAVIRLGAGDGTFGAAHSYTTEGAAFNAISLGDLNSDGVLDLVAVGRAGFFDGYATIRLGAGNGTFGAALSYQNESNNSFALSFGDVNGDGVLDLVTAGYSNNDGYATIRLGAGNGTFGAALSYETEAGWSQAVSLGDLNGDNVLDLVTAGQGDDVVGLVTIRLGAGDGTFHAALSYQTENFGSYALSLGDVNGDGTLDLVTVGEGYYNGSATIRLGAGDGTFGAAHSYATEGISSNALSLGDVNGDGALDLVTAGTSAYGGGYATIRLGAGDGTFDAALSYQTESDWSNDLTLGDLNGDGVLDLITAGYSSYPNGHATIRLSLTQDGVSPLLPFDLSTVAGARQALPVFKQKLAQLSSQRGEIGAFQARINVALNTSRVAAENFASAGSQIMDADVSQESAQLVKNRILQQAGAAVLAQANIQPQLALVLLSNV